MKDLANLMRDLRVVVHPWPQNDGIRTQLQRLGCGHCTMYTKIPDHIICGGNNATALWCAAHNDRLAAQVRVVSLFNRCVERIHVHMQNHQGSEW